MTRKSELVDVYRFPTTVILTICLFVIVSSEASDAAAQRMDYYIYSRGNLQPVKNGNPDQVQPEYWVVWVMYDRNEGLERQGIKCGAHDGKTAGQAMEAAKKYLKFNIKWAKYIYGTHWEENLTNCSGRNLQGPIAVMGDEAPWNPAKIPDGLKEAYEQLQTARETWEQIKEVLDTTNPRVGPKEDNPYEHVGSVLKEYSKNLREATMLFDQLASKVLNGATLGRLQDLTGRLNDALESLRNAEQLAQSEMPGLGDMQHAGAPNRTTGNVPTGRYTGTGFGGFTGEDGWTVDVSVNGSRITINYHVVLKIGGLHPRVDVENGVMSGDIDANSFSGGKCMDLQRCVVQSEFFARFGSPACYIRELSDHWVDVVCSDKLGGGGSNGLTGHR